MNIEQILIDFLLNFTTIETLNAFFNDPRAVAILVVALVSVSGALLGTFLLLRKMSMTSDAISHTVLLGIVVVFLLFTQDLNSPLLIIGAAVAGVVTVVLTEAIFRSGLVKADAALGLAFPLLFAIAIILVSRYADNAHLDEDAVMVGEVGVAWANTNSYCFDNCADVVITPDDPRAEVGRQCVNCSRGGIGPRDDEAVFEEVCSNCGTYSAAEAWRERLIDAPPQLVFWPKAVTAMGMITLVNLFFIVAFYKELKLATFDAGLAAALGFRPGWLHYGLMVLVSVTAVGAFDAVGSVLVVAFFVIPAAAAYLLTDRLSVMLLIAPVVGIAGAYTGYDLARGSFFGFEMSRLLEWFDSTIGLGRYTDWNISISAAMVIMTFVFFLAAWVLSPKYGLISTLARRRWNRQHFAMQMLLGHIHNHQDSAREADELAVATLHQHLNWSSARVQRVLREARLRSWVKVHDGIVHLTARGQTEVEHFIQHNLVARSLNELSPAAVGD